MFFVHSLLFSIALFQLPLSVACTNVSYFHYNPYLMILLPSNLRRSSRGDSFGSLKDIVHDDTSVVAMDMLTLAKA